MNGLRDVSEAPYLFIDDRKASATVPFGTLSDAFLCRFASVGDSLRRGSVCLCCQAAAKGAYGLPTITIRRNVHYGPTPFPERESQSLNLESLNLK